MVNQIVIKVKHYLFAEHIRQRWWQWCWNSLLLKRYHLLCFTSNLSSAIQRGLFSYLCWWWGTLPALVGNDWWCNVERADTGWRLEIINLITSNLHPVPALPSKHHQLFPNRAGNGEWIVIMIASSIFLLIFKNNFDIFCLSPFTVPNADVSLDQDGLSPLDKLGDYLNHYLEHNKDISYSTIYPKMSWKIIFLIVILHCWSSW